MRKILLVAVVCLAFISSPTFGAIVYSGSQVTLQLSQMDPMNPMSMSIMMTIDIASQSGPSDKWDDFTLDLSWVYDTMSMTGMSSLLIYTPGSKMGTAMGMGGIVGISHVASNLPPGTSIGSPNSSFDYDWSLLCGSGNFGEEGGYIGLMLERGTNPDTDLILPPYYGWLHISSILNIGENNQLVIVNGWAYNDQPGMPIGAGQVPIPGAVCLVAIGALCLTTLRRRLKR